MLSTRGFSLALHKQSNIMRFKELKIFLTKFLEISPNELFILVILNRRSYGKIAAIIELPDGKWRAFEIKFGANQIDKAAETLTMLRDDILKVGGIAPSVLCVICGMSNAAYKRPDGVFVVPITALKN